MMTHDEAMSALRERAPMDEFKAKAGDMLAKHPTCTEAEEIAYHFAKWTKKNGTDEELAALGITR